MATPSEKANLTRIRDNQRRSRARRKEYLAEVESKLRTCELLGVEASAEIQGAARRVAEENRMLRALLAQRGGGGAASVSGELRELERMLKEKKPCCPDGNTCGANDGNEPLERNNPTLATSETHISLAAAPLEVGIPLPYHTLAPHMSSPPTDYGRGQATLNPSPAPLAPPVFAHQLTDFEMQLQFIRQQQQQLQSQAATFNNSAPGFNVSQSAPVSSHYSHQTPQPLQAPRSSMSSQHSWHTPTAVTATHTEETNCAAATDMITFMAMRDAHPSDVRADLGCIPGGNGDCKVDNKVVFEVMDRYSGIGV